ncbi:MAG TPA: YhjD/YihY/BrkB family envelope integrity protein, partial [Acidimicrobiia bacterium]|nr:YhjD/YihY/BrkB family envelope integrity protein [Acidimicrobiia bacterium]
AGRITRANRWVRSEQVRVNAAVDTTRDRLEQARPKSKWVDVGFRAWEHDTSSGGAVIAGAVAFRVFLFLVPYVFVGVVGFGVASEAADEDPGRLAREAGIGGLIAKAVGGAADLSGFERATALVVGLFALFLGAKALVKVLRISYGMVWSVRPSKLKKTTLPALGAIGLTTLALLSAALVGFLRHEGVLLAIVGFTLTTAVPFTVALIVAWYLPRRARTWQELVPGAVVVAVGAQLLHIVTVLWIAHVLESKTDTYGAIGAALAILLWAYLLGRLIIASAVIDATLWLRQRELDPGQDDAHPIPEGNP